MSNLSDFMDQGREMKFSEWEMDKTDSMNLTAEISPEGYLHIHLYKDGIPPHKIQLMTKLLRSLADWADSKLACGR